MQVAGLFVHNHARAGADALAVKVRVLGQLLLGLCIRIERPHVAGVIAFGQVVNDTVQPHRREVAFAFGWWSDTFPCFGRHDCNRLSLPAAIVAPLGIPQSNFLVGQVFAIDTHFAVIRLRNLQLFWEPAVRRHRVELPQPGWLPCAPAAEHDVAIGSPALNHIRARVPGEPFGFTAGRVHNVHV